MSKLELFAIGSKVMLHESIEVIITGINIRSDNRVQYEISWVDGRSHSCKWIETVEVSGVSRKLSVGFKDAA